MAVSTVARNPPPPSSWMKWVRRYVGVTLSYGAMRALTYEYDGTQNYYDSTKDKFETKPMLWSHTLGRAMSHSVAAVTVWPVMLGKDLARLECLLRGLDHATYHSGRN